MSLFLLGCDQQSAPKEVNIDPILPEKLTLDLAKTLIQNHFKDNQILTIRIGNKVDDSGGGSKITSPFDSIAPSFDTGFTHEILDAEHCTDALLKITHPERIVELKLIGGGTMTAVAVVKGLGDYFDLERSLKFSEPLVLDITLDGIGPGISPDHKYSKASIIAKLPSQARHLSEFCDPERVMTFQFERFENGWRIVAIE